MARGEDAVQIVGARVAGVAFLLLVAALVLGRAALVAIAAILVGGLYGAELAVADAPLDVAAPTVAVGLLLSVELAYWSIEERYRWSGDPGEGLRRAAAVALVAVSAFVVAALLLVTVEAIRARGLALDLLGATAAAAVLVTILLVTRAQSSRGS
jgi:hypothetical protein